MDVLYEADIVEGLSRSLVVVSLFGGFCSTACSMTQATRSAWIKIPQLEKVQLKMECLCLVRNHVFLVTELGNPELSTSKTHYMWH